MSESERFATVATHVHAEREEEQRRKRGMPNPWANNPGAEPKPHPGTVVNDGGGRAPMTQAEADAAKLAAEGANAAASMLQKVAKLETKVEELTAALALAEQRLKRQIGENEDLRAERADVLQKLGNAKVELGEEIAKHEATKQHLLQQPALARAAGWLDPEEAARLREAAATFEKNSAAAVAVDERRRAAEDEAAILRMQLFTITTALENNGRGDALPPSVREPAKLFVAAVHRLLDRVVTDVDSSSVNVHVAAHELASRLGLIADSVSVAALTRAADDALIEQRRKVKFGRVYVNRWTSGERAIYDAVAVVERMGAHPHLTAAVILLGQARAAVADFAEGVPEKKAACPYGCDAAQVAAGHREHFCPLAVPRL